MSWTNYLHTSIPDVYAVGDCAQTIGSITGRTENVMLASMTTAETRVLGYNLYKIRIKRNFPAALSVFSTEIRCLHKPFPVSSFNSASIWSSWSVMMTEASSCTWHVPSHVS